LCAGAILAFVAHAQRVGRPTVVAAAVLVPFWPAMTFVFAHSIACGR
jgi:hypothetical protein